MAILAGTSGFSYKEWKGSFYPEDLTAADMLSFYAARLPTVELNNTFYRMPRSSVIEGWRDQVPAAFRFSVKASRRITHVRRLKDAAEEIEYLLSRLALLGERLGVILFQLPPHLRMDLDRLRRFLDLLPAGTPAAFEFRHASWSDEDTYEALREHGCALCTADVDEDEEAGDAPVATADWGYLRLRRQSYSDEALRAWAERVRELGWRRAFVYFKHEDAGAGPALAARFLSIAGG